MVQAANIQYVAAGPIIMVTDEKYRNVIKVHPKHTKTTKDIPMALDGPSKSSALKFQTVAPMPGTNYNS